MVDAAADQSVATRHQVGALVVTPTGMLSVGWNGSPAGMSNDCEEWINQTAPLQRSKVLKTKPTTIHAEANAVSKMLRQGVSLEGSMLFISRSPCINCAKLLHNLGLRSIFYKIEHDETEGIHFLRKTGTPCHHFNTQSISQRQILPDLMHESILDD